MPEPSDTTWTCTAQRRNGKFCDRRSIPDAPFPICFQHAGKILEFMRICFGERMTSIDDERVDHFLSYAGGLQAVAIASELLAPPAAQARPRNSVVYYVRVGRFIKIGRTTNLQSRIRSYPPESELLATEPGGELVEAQRLRQFEHALTARQEWFEPADDLLAHIEGLRAA